MPREQNPVTAQRKADKQKEIAKSRKQQQTRNNEKLARRNPERLQRQVEELKELEARGALRPKDKESLGQLERDLKGVRRAREALGAKDEPRRDRDRADVTGGGGGGGGRDGRGDVRQEQRDRRQTLGKRAREEAQDDGGSDTDLEVRRIPMPGDTPPPIPREHYLDAADRPKGSRQPHGLPTKPTAAPQTTYSSAPQMRDLKKEAVRFMPSIVSQQRNRIKGHGRLLEPEEADKLEQSGYMAAQKAADEAALEARFEQVSSEVRKEGMESTLDLDAEADRFEKELKEIYPEDAAAETTGSGAKGVQMEEVDDEGT
ncbi:hypothetical protein LTR53_008629 [Teratosphaeriaceae sp. CCFEE 6253]|nr:hypothetical protein LTR53_008629 [Teratosphaeriaceae sp. CCFEE 6253]